MAFGGTFSSQDLLAPGDRLVTKDAVTGLEWLNVKVTAGHSLRQIEAGAGGWVALGFRPANRLELDQLFVDAGITGGPPRTLANAPGVDLLSSYLGCNLCFQGSTFTAGSSVLFDDAALQGTNLLGHAVFTIDYSGGGFASTIDTYPVSLDHGAANLTTVLVRTVVSSVPEPAAGSLALAGLLGLSLIKPRRQRLNRAR